MPEPFSVSKEPDVRKMIILAENQQVSGESSCVGSFSEIHFTCLLSVCFQRNLILAVVPTHRSAGLLLTSLSWKSKKLTRFLKFAK